ncbi:phage portal protein [Sphingobacterium sp. UBA6320]|uniref:phage portal protein n=1 Tax=Sphingobacterium sp. UBA6320 TaxID=1947510 RepID=UPI0025CF7E6C|nr:phage portal protein [Sphingobacterium sp. UBA6320]
MEEKDFSQLLQGADVDKVKAQMTNNAERVIKALSFYNANEHTISKEPKTKKVGTEDVNNWPLSLPIQKKIVQSTVAFLVGKPIRLVQESENTEKAFQFVSDAWKEMRMNSKLLNLMTKYYSETEAVIMFVPYRDSGATNDDLTIPNTIRCKVVSKSDNEDIFYRFDEYGTLNAWARGYLVKTGGNKNVEHFDVETKTVIYKFKKIDGKWEVETKPNIAGKLSMVLFTQDYWDSYDVDPLIERREVLTSGKAKNNDATGNPILKLTGKVENLPEVAKSVKVVQMEVGGEAEYLYPQMSVDLIKEEREDLKELINYFTDTPDFSMDSMKTIGTTSGKAIELMFFPAILKSIRNRITIEELFDRMMEVIKNLLVKVNPNDTVLKTEMASLKIKFEFTSPLPENEADLIDMLNAATGGKATLSQEEAAGMNPLTKDGKSNWEKLKAENISTFDE